MGDGLKAVAAKKCMPEHGNINWHAFAIKRGGLVENKQVDIYSLVIDISDTGLGLYIVKSIIDKARTTYYGMFPLVGKNIVNISE